MKYELRITETNNKASKYHYQIFDENNNLISERKSNREYVAATINGQYYFGRLDLIGKGDHGRQIKFQISKGDPQVPIAYAKENKMIRVTFDYYGNIDYGKRAFWIHDQKTDQITDNFVFKDDFKDWKKEKEDQGYTIEILGLED